MIKKILLVYYVLVFSHGLAFSFFFATYVIFLTQAGLNLFEVNLLNFICMASCFLFEMPTGSFADNRGRKFSFVLSCLVYSSSMLTYYLSQKFLWFAVAEILAALASAFYSGAFEAWIVDSLHFHDPGYDTSQVFRRSTQLKQFGIMAGTLGGAYIGGLNIALPWLASSVGMALVGIFAFLFMKEYGQNTRTSQKNDFRAYRQTIRKSMAYGFRNSAVLSIMVIGGIQFFAIQGPNMYWSILFNENYGLKVEYLGWVHAATMLVIILGAGLAKRIGEICRSEKGGIVASLALIAFGLIGASLATGAIAVFSGFYLHELARGSFQPLKQNYINSRIPADMRATILSLDGMVSKAGAALGLLVSGILASNFSINVAWFVPSLAVLVILPALLMRKNGQ